MNGDANISAIFRDIREDPIGILRGLGKTDSGKNQLSKISWLCPFKGPKRKKPLNISKNGFINRPQIFIGLSKFYSTHLNNEILSKSLVPGVQGPWISSVFILYLILYKQTVKYYLQYSTEMFSRNPRLGLYLWTVCGIYKRWQSQLCF